MNRIRLSSAVLGIACLIVALLVISHLPAQAQDGGRGTPSFSRSNSGTAGARGHGIAHTMGANPRAPFTFSQSTDPATVTAFNSVSCNSGVAGGFLHTDNSYWRAFDLSAYGISDDFTVATVQFGIEEAASGGGTGQPLTVNLYSQTGAAFPGGTRTPIGTAGFTIADQALTLFDAAVTGTVPAGADLVVEIFTPSGQALGHLFFIGSNAAGQSAPSYISAADCGVTVPTDTTAIAAGMHIVMSVSGTSADYALTVSGACVGDDLVVTLSLGDAPMDVTGTGNGLPFTAPGTGTLTLFGPGTWTGVTVTETGVDSDLESVVLGDYTCLSSAPVVVAGVPVPNLGVVMIPTSSPVVGHVTAGGQAIRTGGGSELALPSDADGNGFDTYVVTEVVEDGDVIWLGLFVGSENWVWVQLSDVIPLTAIDGVD